MTRHIARFHPAGGALDGKAPRPCRIIDRRPIAWPALTTAPECSPKAALGKAAPICAGVSGEATGLNETARTPLQGGAPGDDHARAKRALPVAVRRRRRRTPSSPAAGTRFVDQMPSVRRPASLSLRIIASHAGCAAGGKVGEKARGRKFQFSRTGWIRRQGHCRADRERPSSPHRLLSRQRHDDGGVGGLSRLRRR